MSQLRSTGRSGPKPLRLCAGLRLHHWIFITRIGLTWAGDVFGRAGWLRVSKGWCGLPHACAASHMAFSTYCPKTWKRYELLIYACGPLLDDDLFVWMTKPWIKISNTLWDTNLSINGSCRWCCGIEDWPDDCTNVMLLCMVIVASLRRRKGGRRSMKIVTAHVLSHQPWARSRQTRSWQRMSRPARW